jgi:hypothetical protein
MCAYQLLGNRYEGDAVTLEHLDHPREVGQTPGQAVNLVDHHDVDSPRLDVGQQTLQRRALGVAAGVAGVVVVVGHRNPALDPLAGDVSMPRFLLGIDGVELLVETFVRGYPAIDAQRLRGLGEAIPVTERLLSGRRRAARSSAGR